MLTVDRAHADHGGRRVSLPVLRTGWVMQKMNNQGPVLQEPTPLGRITAWKDRIGMGSL